MNDTNGLGAPPPGRPPGPPPAPPSAPPPQPSAPPSGQAGGALVLRVSRRMLWAGSAAFPLHNITMVEAFMYRPSRLAALVRCLKWLVGALLVYLAYVALNAMDSGGGGDADNPALLVVLCIAALVVPLKDLFAPPKPVLSVQVSSGTALVVTLPSLEELRRIADRIAYAIDHPEAEFTAVVHQYNTNNYGPVANLNGGQGNTGFKL
ncbi:DUF6232 family protein [Streptomyces lavenduligriseus]|uniref:DUF6232 family protein n=1 Tax=Streptomyces lavenduligriseus TaxID=67315 RepID=A0ABT0NWA7_9ACTN|nr:DUF6232 family protein [Streptomyces lavenduligriseus]MCL3995426.1 DUF6232 family protein [Streptomyces lavenduligriseus]